MIYPAVMLLLLIGVACGTASEEPATAPAAEPAAPAAQQQPAQQQPAAAPAQSQPAQAAAQPAQQTGQGVARPAAASAAEAAAMQSAAPTPTALPQQAKVITEVAVVDDAPYGTLRIANKDLGPPQFLPKNMAVPQATYVSPVIFDALWKVSPSKEAAKRPAGGLEPVRRRHHLDPHPERGHPLPPGLGGQRLRQHQRP